jgi:sulfatase maturation enzyme AslB (radical SAM superfamily)
MHVNELIIEITRRCNIQCMHCLRGPAQNKDIDNKTIDKILEGIRSISCVTFTGGEPSLAVSKIKYFTKRVKELGIEVSSFYVITNGKIASVAMAHALMDLYVYCSPIIPMQGGRKVYDPEDFMGGLAISQDQYHREIGYEIDSAQRVYSGLSFFRPKDRMQNITEPIDEGWARINGLGRRSTRPIMNVIGLDRDGNVETVDEVLYVNALGDVVPDCDLSYESQKECKIGNVHETPLPEIMKQLAGPAVEEDCLVKGLKL